VDESTTISEAGQQVLMDLQIATQKMASMQPPTRHIHVAGVQSIPLQSIPLLVS